MHLPPRLSLANLPTRIHLLPKLSQEMGVNIYIKRDDQTGGETSGNKIRKLEFVLKDAIDKGCSTVITCGGLQSNHARSTTAAAVSLGIKAVLVLKTTGEIPPPDGNHFISQLLGAEIHYISEDDYRERRGEIMLRLQQSLATHGEKAYIIPEGASDGLGCYGYYDCFNEILVQEKQLNLQFDTVVTAVGSGGTYAGLFAANKISRAGKRIAGFNVCDTALEFQTRIALELEEMLNITQTKLDFNPQEIDITDGYVGIAYAQSRPEELELIAHIARTDGVILDPVYTGKAMYGLCQEIKAGKFKDSKNLLFLHTGGLFGLFPKRAQMVTSDE